MKQYDLKDFTRGWFIGAFEPNLYYSDQFECAVKQYQSGSYEKRHFHKIATEITVIISGRVRMNGNEYKEGDIIVQEPGEATDFEALTEVKNIVVKIPSVKGDKYEI